MAENWNKSFSYIEYHATPILTVVSVALLIPFRYDLNEIRAYSTPKSGTEPIPGMQPSTFEIGSAQRSAAQLRSATEFAMESPLLCANWSPIWPAVYDFCRGAKVFRCILSSVSLACTTANINFSCLLSNLNGFEESGRILDKVNTSEYKRKEFQILLY